MHLREIFRNEWGAPYLAPASPKTLEKSSFIKLFFSNALFYFGSTNGMLETTLFKKKKKLNCSKLHKKKNPILRFLTQLEAILCFILYLNAPL